LDHLLPQFEAKSGYRVEVYSGSDVYDRARRGEADLVISHLGKGAVEDFVTSGAGLWPRPVFASQMVIIGPASDPAGIRSTQDPIEAMRRIAAAKAGFVVGESVGRRYLAALLLAGAGAPDRGDWFEQKDFSGNELIRYAEERGAYALVKGPAFAQFSVRHESGMRILLDESPLLYRVMAIVPVNPARVDGINTAGVAALVEYLLSAETQAAIANFRHPATGVPMWSPAARHNHSKGLPRPRG
ncbi:MAG TPA: substrate-binding domain-containing protein, partial [Gammaproteobacteria bacterium]|nr:substrate-binding domain-containing protein [Gammaproteobacteria bacterium]